MKAQDSAAGHESRMSQSKEANGDFLNRGLCFVLQRANLAISRQLDDALRPVGLTGRQLLILGTIAEQGSLRQAVLADMIGKDHTTVTANLKPLIRRGLIVSDVDRDDRRGRMIALTPDGEVLLERAHGIVLLFNAKLSARIQNMGSIRDLYLVLDALSQHPNLPDTAAAPHRGSGAR